MSDSKTVSPYTPVNLEQRPGEKRQQVERMFDKISPYYDILNRVLSLGIDRSWRREAVKRLSPKPDLKVLDMATGTGDLAIEILKQHPGAHVTGIDIARDMLRQAGKKIEQLGKSGQFEMLVAPSEAIPINDQQFDAAMVAFGVRNFENTLEGLSELRRVLKPGGQIIVLEFSRIRTFPIKQAFNLYFGRVLPWIGKVWSKDPRAYRYLYESVQAFPDGKEFGNLLESAGFVRPEWKTLTFGICSIYVAYAPGSSR